MVEDREKKRDPSERMKKKKRQRQKTIVDDQWSCETNPASNGALSSLFLRRDNDDSVKELVLFSARQGEGERRNGTGRRRRAEDFLFLVVVVVVE